MTKERQYRNLSTSIWWKILRSAMTGPTVGILLLSLVAEARSQEEKTPKPPSYSVLYTFTGGADGGNPNLVGPGAGLTRDEEGNFYGTTSYGGDLASPATPCNGIGCGVVFKLTPHENCKDSEKGSEVLPSQRD
jgi:hypothetical protein